MTSRLSARVRLKFALQMARTIQRYRKGDIRIFDNKVDSDSKVLVTEAIMVKHIKAIAEEAKEYYPVTCRQLLGWLQA